MDSLPPDPYAITTPEALATHYGEPSQLVLNKVSAVVDPTSAAFIAASPFCILSTVGPRGVHGTPRGDGPGLVTVLDERTLALPDRRGNNRIDALRDVIDDPRVALLFLVPGNGETLRVGGLARLTADPALRARLAMDGREPATVMLISVREVFMQCRRAVSRAKLWAGREAPAGLPTAGQMIEAHTGGLVDAATVDARMPELDANLY
ncbi:pyridoxamine 5'-phosphate oxidase family protein [Roseomonas sp. NAR14]|uniref:Pyridoxamine 5'-phosphate oxidase family protein n=1 Tax=Roseomonas acroporae TaxID=2937791 RepID=A0A9X1Y8B9_9PROT|nr:MSMEG_1061 family FMN-dependent PPOX-type flavoprotein [Roseomonas acroporae]MCK8784100.1 pyridoxamine 5'-phosphate oxidase family protein [Roseomonas acroporae]